METNKTNWSGYIINLPHIQVMEDLKITIEQLNPEIQQKVLLLEKILLDAFKDGIVDEQESEQIMELSIKIGNEIIESVDTRKTIATGIFAGLGFAALAFLGIRQLTK